MRLPGKVISSPFLAAELCTLECMVIHMDRSTPRDIKRYGLTLLNDLNKGFLNCVPNRKAQAHRAYA